MMTNPAKKIGFDFWQNLPQVTCGQCKEIYRMYEVENFICTNCLEEKESLRKQKFLKEKKINYLLEHANIPKRYRTSNFNIKSV